VLPALFFLWQPVALRCFHSLTVNGEQNLVTVLHDSVIKTDQGKAQGVFYWRPFHSQSLIDKCCTEIRVWPLETIQPISSKTGWFHAFLKFHFILSFPEGWTVKESAFYDEWYGPSRSSSTRQLVR